MNQKESIYKLFLLFFCYLYFSGCSSENLVRPEECIKNKPIEDTNRVWMYPKSTNQMKIMKDIFFVSFYSWVKDTNIITDMLKKYKIKTVGFGINYYFSDSVLSAGLTSIEGMRSEYHFTPYGKNNYCNFGADSMVEYSFGIFDNYLNFFDGHMTIFFDSTTSALKIDSLLKTNGLRFVHTGYLKPNQKYYETFITPKAKKNILDLSQDLKLIPFIRHIDIGFGTTYNPKFN